MNDCDGKDSPDGRSAVDGLAHRTFRGVVWSFAERFSSQAIGFIVILVMARMLTPADYGLVGMLTIFIEVGTALSDSGFSQALIRRLNSNQTDSPLLAGCLSRSKRSQADISTMFWFNIAVGAALYMLLYILAPHIAHYYNQPQLTNIARVIGLLLIINALMIVPKTLLSAALDFRTQTRVSLIAYTLSGVAGICMAANSFGVMAIVFYQLLSQGLLCLLLWITNRWSPSLRFSPTAFRDMFGFGSRLAVAGLMDVIYRNSYLMVIGKTYSSADLGCFTRAQQIGGFLSANVSGVIQKVSYPSLCALQNDMERLRHTYLRMLRISSFGIFPLMWGIVALSQPIVHLLLGEKWMFAAALLPILSLSFMWHHVQSLNCQLLQVGGHTDLLLRMEFVKKGVGVALLLLAAPLGLKMLCWSLVASAAVSLICNTYYNRRLYRLGLLRQLRTVMPPFVVSAVSACCVWCVTQLIGDYRLQLVAGLAVGVVVYALWSLLFDRRDVETIASYLTRR